MVDSEFCKLLEEVKKYVDREIKHLEDKVQLMNSKNVEVSDKFEKEMERRLKDMNEFRSQLDKQTRSFITREEYVLSEKLINQKLDVNSKIIYIGIGIVVVLEFILRVVLKI